MAKIAFNYALDYGIDINELKHGLNIIKNKDTIEKISFNYPMIPFTPLNQIDHHIELETDMEPYHNMILFSQHNTLWCYIDLFNTFQYYVLLSDKWDCSKPVYTNYAQYLLKRDLTLGEKVAESIPDILSPKDIYMYSKQYNVEPTMDIKQLRERIKNAINKKSRIQPMSDIISKKIQTLSPFAIYECPDRITMMTFFNAMNLYIDEKNEIRTKNFRTITPSSTGEIASYPWLINRLRNLKKLDTQMYTLTKFERLNAYLISKSEKKEK